jgi:hypothetical protein
MGRPQAHPGRVVRGGWRSPSLCKPVQEAPPLFRVLWGLWMYYEVRPDLGKSRELAERLFTLAQRAQDPAQLLQARLALAVTSLSLGDAAATRRTHGARGCPVRPQGKGSEKPYLGCGWTSQAHRYRGRTCGGTPARTVAQWGTLVRSPALARSLRHHGPTPPSARRPAKYPPGMAAPKNNTIPPTGMGPFLTGLYISAPPGFRLVLSQSVVARPS